MATVGPTPGPGDATPLDSSPSSFFLARRRPSFVTCDRALAGVSGCRGTDPVGRRGDVVAAVFDDDGVAAGAVGDVDHGEGAVVVAVDGGLLRFPVWILRFKR